MGSSKEGAFPYQRELFSPVHMCMSQKGIKTPKAGKEENTCKEDEKKGCEAQSQQESQKKTLAGDNIFAGFPGGFPKAIVSS
jgi:hypothetical protein